VVENEQFHGPTSPPNFSHVHVLVQAVAFADLGWNLDVGHEVLLCHMPQPYLSLETYIPQSILYPSTILPGPCNQVDIDQVASR
jgi:hypothetical protein